MPQIAALARRVDEIVVLALGARPAGLPENVRVCIFGGGSYGRAGTGARLAWNLAAELARPPRPLAVVAHMSPVFALVAAPLARPLGVPVLLWYTQWGSSATLRAAARLSTCVLSVDRRSFPLASGDVRAIGHGIDVSRFACAEPSAGRPLRALALGRYAPVKGYPTLLRALRFAADEGLDVRLGVHGPTLTPAEAAHRVELSRLAADLSLTDVVDLGGPVEHERVPALLAASDVLLSDTAAGSADKAVYEACAACRPALASSPVYDTLLPESLRFPGGDATMLALRLRQLAALDRSARGELGRTLRVGVERAHSVETWADGVLAAAQRR